VSNDARQPFVVGTGEGKVVECFGTQYTIKTTVAQSGGAIGLIEDLVPVGDGPPMHVHHREDEIFYILEGQFQVWCSGQTWIADPSSTIFLPRGVPHTYRNVGDGLGRKLITVVPGGFEGFFEEVAEGGLRIPEDMAKLQELAASYGLEFTGPPPWI
jgi:quercetin dioxygenase-like cupin family protein